MGNKEQQLLIDRLDDISDSLERKLNTKNSFGEYTGDILNSINYNLERIADSLEKVSNLIDK